MKKLYNNIQYTKMKNIIFLNSIKIQITIIVTLLFGSISCDSKVLNPKQLIANKIANESCSYLSDIASSFLIEVLKNSLNKTNVDELNGFSESISNLLPEYCCECYTYYISNDLAAHFTLIELNELVDDRIKLTIALIEIFNKNKNSIAFCIESIAQKKFQDYEDFEYNLQNKLNSTSE